jgi:hypothetical protein
MSKEQPFQCKIPGCENCTSRIPHVCTKHFIEGWGRIKPLPAEEQAPLYVSDKQKGNK